MADDNGFNEELDAAIEDILPDDLEESVQEAVAQADHDAPAGAWLLQEYSLTQQVNTTLRDEIAEQEIQTLAAELDVPVVATRMANSLFGQYAETTDQPILIELYAAAAFYCACKVNEVPVSPSEISDVGGELLTRKVLLRRSKHIASTLGLDASAFFEPTQYVERYCGELGLPESTNQRAKEILEIAAEAELTSGKSPRGLAAAAVYNAALEQGCDITQMDIADVADVTVVTIRNRYKEQREALNRINAAPEDPEAAIEWVANRLEVPDSSRDQAQELFALAQEELPSEAIDRDLALACLRIVSEESPNQAPLSYRALRGLTESESDSIRERRRRLKRLLRTNDEQVFSNDPEA